MHFSAQQIAAIIGGSIEGNPDVLVSNISKIEEAQQGTLTFLANPKYEQYIYSTQASIVMVSEGIHLTAPVTATLIKVKDAYSSFALLLEKYQEVMAASARKGIEQPSFIADTATIAEDVYIGAFVYVSSNAKIGKGVKVYPGCYIGDGVIVGNNTVLFPGVKIYDGCVVGAAVVLHAGVVIGSDGFGFAPQQAGNYKKVPQIGNVIIEDNVEIGANTTIDRATIGSTVIRKGVKLDNLIQIAHNVEIGSNTVIAAQTGVSGSTKIGEHCMIGGQAGLVGHISIANGTRINAQSGVSKTISAENTALTGSPAFDYKSSLKSQAIFRNLPELQQQVAGLEAQLKELKALIKENNS